MDPFFTRMDDEDMQFSIVESSVDSELSSAIVTLLKIIEDQGKLLPVVDIIYEFLTSRVYLFEDWYSHSLEWGGM